MPARIRLAVFLMAALPARAVDLDIPVFAGGYGTAFYTESARAFEAVRPGAHVRIYGDPRVQDQVRVRAMDGQFPDAACVAYVLWPALIKSGKVLDLAPYLAGRSWDGGRWGDTFLPGALDTWKVEGRIYGLPVSYACWTIFYNKALFRANAWRVPRTWDEFFDLCGRIRASGVAPLSVPGTRWLYADAFLRAAYYNLAGAEGWMALNGLRPGARTDPRFVRSAELEQEILRRFALRGWEGETHTGAELSFLQGRAAMTVSGSWLVSEMKGKIPAGFELGAMNFPVFRDGVGDPGALQTGSDCFFVFATGDKVREGLTVDFLRFLTSRARAEAFVRELDSPVAVRGVPLSLFSERMRDTAEMIAGAKTAFAMPQQMLQPPALRQALVDESERLTTGRITAEEFSRSLEAAAAEDRARLADPGRVEYRHPVAGAALIAIVAAMAAALGWRGFRGGGRGAPGAAREAYLGPLRTGAALGFVGPAGALYAAFVLGPALAACGWAFTQWDGIGPRAFAGLFNFKSLLFDSDVFWMALKNNLYLMVVPALVVVPLALLFAALFHRGVWGARVFRVVFLFPNMLGGLAATLIWLSAYEPHGGLVNAGLSAIGRALRIGPLAGIDGYPWLAPAHLYTALIPIYVWMACGFNLVLYLAAMEGIDPQLYEAAALDGASPWRQFFTMTLPLIREVIAISAVFLVINGLNAFEMVWLLTSQQPQSSTHTLGTLLVTKLFQDMSVGQATALAVILFALVFAAGAAVFRLLRRDAIEA